MKRWTRAQSWLKKKLKSCPGKMPRLEIRLSYLGAPALVDTLARINEIKPVPQAARLATYAPRLTKSKDRLTGRRPAQAIDFGSEPFSPGPGET